jgi:hypothetical protein
VPLSPARVDSAPAPCAIVPPPPWPRSALLAPRIAVPRPDGPSRCFDAVSALVRRRRTGSSPSRPSSPRPFVHAAAPCWSTIALVRRHRILLLAVLPPPPLPYSPCWSAAAAAASFFSPPFRPHLCRIRHAVPTPHWSAAATSFFSPPFRPRRHRIRHAPAPPPAAAARTPRSCASAKARAKLLAEAEPRDPGSPPFSLTRCYQPGRNVSVAAGQTKKE